MDGRPVSALAGLSLLRYHVATKRASPPPSSPWSLEASWGSLFIRRRPRLTPIVPFHPRGNLPDANLRPWSCGLPRKSMTPLIYTHTTPPSSYCHRFLPRIATSGALDGAVPRLCGAEEKRRHSQPTSRVLDRSAIVIVKFRSSNGEGLLQRAILRINDENTMLVNFFNKIIYL